jgi:dolichyl-phosphate-mannose--protein O-mannosyl transferase
MPSLWSAPRTPLRAVWLLIALAALMRLPRLGTPPQEVFDEIYHARTAQQYLQGLPPTEWVHPPFAKLLIALGIFCGGYSPSAYRLLPALAGIALAPALYGLALQMRLSRRAAWLASVLLLCDGVYLVQSRMAMTNIFAVLFQVAAMGVTFAAIACERILFRHALAMGLVWGMALATRWTSLWALGFALIIALIVRRRTFYRLRELALGCTGFVWLPAVVYLASYIPWMMQGHDLCTVLKTQAAMWRYHATLVAEHPYFSAWYTWPWLIRPTWYHYSHEETWVRGILAVGNPALWWASVPITLWALWSGVRARDARRLMAGLGFCALYLPWAISPRQLNYSHYLFEALPYACLSLAMGLDQMLDGGNTLWAKSYLVLCVLLLLLYFPLLTALPLPAWIFEAWRFKAWLHSIWRA